MNREAERQKDLQKKFPEVSNSEPSKTKTQHVSEKACDMCFSLVCLLYYQFAECHVAFLQHGRIMPYGSSLMKACKKQKLDKPGQQSIGGSKKDSSIFKLPEMLKSCSVLGYSDYVLPRGNISAIHVDTVRRCSGKRTIACNLYNSHHGASCEGYIEKLPREGECTNPEAEGTWKFVRSHKISFLKSQIVIGML